MKIDIDAMSDAQIEARWSPLLMLLGDTAEWIRETFGAEFEPHNGAPDTIESIAAMAVSCVIFTMQMPDAQGTCTRSIVACFDDSCLLARARFENWHGQSELWMEAFSLWDLEGAPALIREQSVLERDAIDAGTDSVI